MHYIIDKRTERKKQENSSKWNYHSNEFTDYLHSILVDETLYLKKKFK